MGYFLDLSKEESVAQTGANLIYPCICLLRGWAEMGAERLLLT